MFVRRFDELDRAALPLAGGKGAHLGELSSVDGIRVPDGFCVTTDAYRAVTGSDPELSGLLEELSRDSGDVSRTAGRIRQRIENLPVPEGIVHEVYAALAAFDVEQSFAVRSSATAEDLPSASFAGQQDTYLNIKGKESVLRHIQRCWASLFTDRAVAYRRQQGFDHREVFLAVVVQQMVFSEVSGILFTADPLSGNRRVSTIDASFGLGEALVSGLVSADTYRVRSGEIREKQIGTKKRAVLAAPEGGTREVEPEAGSVAQQALTDAQIRELERIGRTIEGHFGEPQDIEWCLSEGVFYVVQSRPITTLFPVPQVDDNENHVYISVGHQQMMTDPIRPLGLSFFLMFTPAPMQVAGGRLFVDVTKRLSTLSGRANLLGIFGQSDPLIRDALATVIERGDFLPTLPDESAVPGPIRGAEGLSAADILDPVPEPAGAIADLIRENQASVERLKQEIQGKSGTDLFDFIRLDMEEARRVMNQSPSLAIILAGVNGSVWLNSKMEEWLGEKNAADALTQSLPNNVTAEMGLALLDVADVIRPYPQVVEYLPRANPETFPDSLPDVPGSREAKEAIRTFLDRYGMRCTGEIDVTRTRWSERPATLIPLLLGNIHNQTAGAGKRKYELGLAEASAKAKELLGKLAGLPDGENKVQETRRMIDAVRLCMSYREYPKYGLVNRYFVYKQALMKEVERLVAEGVFSEKEDSFYLSFDELKEVVRSRRLSGNPVPERKEAYRHFEKLTPPRVMTSEGEAIAGRYRRDNIPAHALAGLAVSSGIVEGRARVVLRMENAGLEEGDILVTPFTDPSWTPVFVSVKALITEVGGLMTHGAVIAREYGLPAVVGIEDATRRIRDGQRIRVNGTDGYVEILSE